jgi:NAD(P)-dependent dehydrogenase (short-subunit alcohol dehydrogenase family)
MEKLEGRGAVVVGGGGGIGRGIALALADEGALVLVADLDLGNAEGVRDEIIARGGEAHARQVDATDPASLERLASEAAASLGDVHLLVNTVGVITDAGVTTASEDVWRWFIEIHLMSLVHVVNAFLPLLRASDGGSHIVITSSISGLLALPPSQTGGLNTGVYRVLKHAVVGYGAMLRQEVAADGIGVSVLCPGLVHTNLDANSARHRPERFGGPMPEPKELVVPNLVSREPEDLGPIVVRGIEANRFYIFTHPEFVEPMRRHQQHVLDDFAFFGASETPVETARP